MWSGVRIQTTGEFLVKPMVAVGLLLMGTSVAQSEDRMQKASSNDGSGKYLRLRIPDEVDR